MDYKTLTEDLVKLCLKKGADAAEVYLEINRQLSIELRNQEIETVEEASSHGVGIRVLTKNRMAFASCNDFQEKSLEETITRAITMSRFTTADENNVLPQEKGFSEVEGLYDPELNNVSIDKKIALAKEAEKIALSFPQVTKSAGASYGESEQEIFLANSNGLSKNFKESGCSFGVYVVAEKGEEKSTGGEYCSRRFFADLKEPKEVAQKAAQDAVGLLDARMVKTQQAAVIFDPDVARAILGGILGAVNGERVLQGASFLKDKLNQKIASDLITIIDDGLLPKGLASRPFDGEGVPTQKRAIVEKGILKNFMYNTIVAKRAGVKSTGNASRGGFTSLPSIGPHNFYLAAGSHSPEEIIKATKKGLLVKGVTGYGINPVNGHFSGGASGYWIENGRIAFPVKGLTIAGVGLEMLMSIDMVGNDLDLNRGFTAPTFRIPLLQIGGE